MHSLGSIVSNLIEGYTFIIVLWCLLSWFPNIRWYEQPFSSLNMIVKPVMEPFRRLIPAMGGIDISPMIAILFLQFIARGARMFL